MSSDEAEARPAWAPMRRVFKRAFQKDVLRASMEGSSLPPDRPAEAATAAWRSHDRASFIWAMRARARKAGIQPLWLERFARALLDANYPAEALDVLLRGRSDIRELTSDEALTATLCWLRLGAVAEAVRGLEACAAVGTDDAVTQLIAHVRRALAAVDGAPSPASWPDTRALLEPLLELELPELAASVVQGFLERIDEPEPAEISSIVEQCFAIFRTARPEAVRRLLAAMAPLYRVAGAQEAFLEALVELDADGGEAIPWPRAGKIREDLSACLAAALAATGHWRAAARRYVFTPGTTGLLSQVMSELARAVGRDVASSVTARPRGSTDRPKVVDMFPFNGEFDVLELKLEAMAGWVDRFVIVEAATTYTGLPKTLRFPEAADRFARYRDKIVYRSVEDFPTYLSSAWAREFYQRDQALHALAEICGPDDVVILSDVDEVIDEAAVRAFVGPVAGADLRTFCFFLNCERLQTGDNVKAALARWRVVSRTGCNWLRIGARMHLGSATIAGAGWHFTNMATADELASKHRSYSHQERAHADKAFFEGLIGQLKSGGLEGYRRLDPEAMPEFVRRRRHALAHLLLD